MEPGVQTERVQGEPQQYIVPAPQQMDRGHVQLSPGIKLFIFNLTYVEPRSCASYYLS